MDQKDGFLSTTIQAYHSGNVLLTDPYLSGQTLLFMCPRPRTPAHENMALQSWGRCFELSSLRQGLDHPCEVMSLIIHDSKSPRVSAGKEL